jgi:tight adherence protein C
VTTELLAILALLATAAGTAALILGAVEAVKQLSKKLLLTSDDGALLSAPAEEAMAGSSLNALRRTLIAFLAVLNKAWVPQKHLDRLRASLRRAGHPFELSPEEIVAFMELGAFFFLLCGVSLSLWADLSPLVWLISLVLGAVYPLIWLRDKVKFRHHQITRALPYNLDLLTLSVEAGLDFAAALGKVVEKGRKGPLADELGITLKELKLGKTREEALKNLAARVELSSLTSFVAALVQADKMGTSLGKVLRILSTQMRIERTQRAEKLANEAPVKLLLPLIGCIFPTIFIMLFGPIAFQIFFGDF